MEIATDKEALPSLKERRNKKLKLDSDSEGDSDYGSANAAVAVDEKSHDSLIQSLKSSLKTKGKRRRIAENIGILDPDGNIIDGIIAPPKLLSFFSEKNSNLLKEFGFTKPGKKAKKKNDDKPLSLTTTLKKPVVKKIQRETLYNNVKKEVSKWNSVVYHNRLADQLVFPLPEGDGLKKKDKAEDNDFVPMTPLEEKMALLLHGEGYVERRKAEVFGKKEVVNDQDEYVRTIEEAVERHHELARLRAFQSYEMAKAKRKGKIKSKKYHRLQRREKIRKQMKEFEELQKTDPEAAMVKLEELDKARIEERMSLKHRNTSKWAKSKLVRAKYNRESRAELSDQLKISRALTVKIAESTDEESDPDDIDLEIPSLVKSSLENPWCLTDTVKGNDKVSMYYTGYKKFWDDVNARKERERKRIEREEARLQKEENEKQKKQQKLALINAEDSSNSEPPLPPPKKVKKKVKKLKRLKISKEPLITSADVPQELSIDDLDDLLNLANQKLVQTLKKKMKRLKNKIPSEQEDDKDVEVETRNRRGKNRDGDIDEIRDLNVDHSDINIEGTGNVDEDDSFPLSRNTSIKSVEVSVLTDRVNTKVPEKLIDPAHFLEIRKSTKFDMKNSNLDFGDEDHLSEDNDNDEEKEVEHLKMIAEAFEDEDLIGEFERRKAEEVEGAKPKDVDLTLPGWGEWGGSEIKPSKRKRKFIKKALPPPPRRDSNLPHVILNDTANTKLREHQVKELPFPFTRVADYEKIVRAPMGRTWLPEQGMKDLIAPKIITRLGGIIQPIGEEVLVKKGSKEKQKTLKIHK